MPCRQLAGQTFIQPWRQLDGEFCELSNGVDIEINVNSDWTFHAHAILRVALSIETSAAVPVSYVSLPIRALMMRYRPTY
jgi:hypothetical protein